MIHSFEQLVEELRKQGNIIHMRDMIHQLHGKALRLANPEVYDTTTASTTVSTTVNARVLMAAYMVSISPEKVFETMGETETKLLESSNTFLKRFEDILQCLSTGMAFEDVPRELTLDFPNIIMMYLRDFALWKTPDQQKLRDRLETAIKALNSAFHSLPEHGMETDRVEITKQMQRMRNKFVSLFGEESFQQLGQTVLSDQAVQCIDVPRSFLRNDLFNVMTAYELLLDANYKIQDDVETDELGNKPFLIVCTEVITADYNRGDFLSTHNFFDIIKGWFTNLFDNIGTMQAAQLNTEVLALLDKGNVTSSLMTWESTLFLVKRLVEIISILQQHHRHQESEAKWEGILAGMTMETVEDKGRALAQALKFLHDCCRQIFVDHANNRLSIITPVVREYGVEYQRGKFITALEEGKITLNRTTDWLTPVLHDLKVKDLQKLLDDDFSLGKVYRAAMVNLITGGKLDGDSMPEVFRFDLKRFKAFAAAYNKAVVCACIMRTIGNFVQESNDTNESNIEAVVNSLCSDAKPSLMTLISLMVLAHNPQNAEEVGQLFNCIAQTKLQTMLSTEQLEEMRMGMQTCLEDASDVRATV